MIVFPFVSGHKEDGVDCPHQARRWNRLSPPGKKVEQIVPGSRHTAPYSQEVPLSWRIIIRPLKYICVKPSKILGRVSQTFIRNPAVKGGKVYLPNPQTFFG